MDKSKTKRRKKRRPTRRLRYDRVFLVLAIPAAVVIGITMAVSRCSAPEQSETQPSALSASTPDPDTETVSPDLKPDQTPAATVTAAEAGRRDAVRVAEAAPESMERQEALLAIHARVSAIRAKGYIHAADEYMDAVRSYLRTHTDIQI